MDLEQTLDGLLSEFLQKMGIPVNLELLDDLKWKIIGVYSANTVDIGQLSQWLPPISLSVEVKKES